MLCPASDDKNRENELKRMKLNPESFGTELMTKYPDDWQDIPLGSKEVKMDEPKKRGRPAKQ